MGGNQAQVPVLGTRNDLLSYTNPARARKLVASGRASVVNRSRFTIKLFRDPKEDKMQKSLITNFTKYFAQERDVFVQNRTNTQVSMQFELGPDRVESILIPKSRDPLNLTQLVPFAAIKSSIDLRKLINRKPPALALMSEQEYLDYYEEAAKDAGVSLEGAIVDAQGRQQALQNKTAYTNPTPTRRLTTEETSDLRENDPPDPQDIVTARVVGLCNKTGDSLQPSEKVSARDMLSELKGLEGEGTGLTRADFEYLLGHGTYPSVKKWAQVALTDKFDSDSDE